MSVATVEAAWASKIWAHASITAITTSILNYEYTEQSEKELSALFYQQEINFWEYVVAEDKVFDRIGYGGPSTHYQVDVRYTREKDTAGSNYRAARDAFSTLLSLIESELTTNWNSTVDFYEIEGAPVELISDIIGDREVWRGVIRFRGIT